MSIEPIVPNAIEQIKASRRTRQSGLQKAFMLMNYVFFALLSLMMVYPFWHVLMYSFSDVTLSAAGGLFLLPRGFTTATYESVFASPLIWSSFRISVTVTLAGTFLGVLLTALTAYPLSKKRLRFGGVVLFLVFFTMLFSGGMIPSYLLVKRLKWLDSINALIFPGLLSAYNVIVMKSFFASLPESLEESARIDGANDILIFFMIILPLSKAVLATIALFIAVVYWNDYFSTVIYITTKSKWSMQAVLREMLTNTTSAMRNAGVDINQTAKMSSETIKSATVIIATVPILVVYPFLQKHFVKGVMLGSIKG
jgi:putative aldouronate transport system permease protein